MKIMRTNVDKKSRRMKECSGLINSYFEPDTLIKFSMIFEQHTTSSIAAAIEPELNTASLYLNLYNLYPSVFPGET